MSNQFEQLLQNHSLRITVQRRQIFDVLVNAQEPISLGAIHENCPAIDRASVYRTIHAFSQIGVVKLVNFGWKKRYELTDLFSPHHHHIRCTACGTIKDILDPKFEKAIVAIGEEQGFAVVSHHLEIEGICQDCSVRKPNF